MLSSFLDVNESKGSIVCWVVNERYDMVGGAGERLRAEIRHFESIGVKFKIICRDGNEGLEGHTIGLVTPTRLLPLYLLEVLLRSLRAVQSSSRVVFIVHDPPSAIPVSIISRIFHNRSRTFLVVHGPMSLEQEWLSGRAFLRSLRYGFLSFLERLAYELVDQLFPVSKYEMNYLATRYGVGSKARIIRNGISFERFNVRPEAEIRTILGLGQTDIVVANVGHLYPYRGLEFLIQAMAIVKKNSIGRKVRLLVIGGGTEQAQEENRRLVEDLGLKDIVVFLSDRTDIPRFLKISDIYASHFSNKVEGIGIAIMEAMASGLPVVTGRDRITDSLLRDHQNCLLVEKENATAIADAVLSLASSSEMRRKIGQDAQSSAHLLFSVETMVKKCESYYVDNAFKS